MPVSGESTNSNPPERNKTVKPMEEAEEHWRGRSGPTKGQVQIARAVGLPRKKQKGVVRDTPTTVNLAGKSGTAVRDDLDKGGGAFKKKGVKGVS